MSERKKTSTYQDWDYHMTIPHTDLEIRGHSRGSEKTGFYLPKLKLFLDAGLQSYFNPNTILITHCHTDHCFALPMLLTGLVKQPQVYVPKEHKHLFENFNDACFQLSQGNTDMKMKSFSFFGVVPGDHVSLGQNYFAQVFELDHSVVSVGYGIYEKRHKLKPEYKNLSGKQIKQLRDCKVSITEEQVFRQLAFVCDTTVKCFDLNPDLLKFPSIMIECTFLDDQTVELAQESKHIHWNDLKPVVLKNPLITFILIHFSMRYSEIEIPDQPPNVILWLN